MNTNIFLCCFFTFLCSILIQDTHSKSYDDSDSIKYGIVGGWLASIEEHPYQVHLIIKEEDGSSLCGGSIISPRFVLTAAHCIKGASLVKVRAGTSFKNKGGTFYESTRIVVHPLYDPKTLDYDVGYIDLQINMTLDGKSTKTIKLPPLKSSVLQPGTDLLVSGWGLTSFGGTSSEQLKAAIIPTVSHADCRKTFHVTPRMFCAGYTEGGTDSCFGDSGSPAVDRETGEQVGVVSWGGICAHPNLPSGYADLTNNDIREWINLNTGV